MRHCRVTAFPSDGPAADLSWQEYTSGSPASWAQKVWKIVSPGSMPVDTVFRLEGLRFDTHVPSAEDAVWAARRGNYGYSPGLGELYPTLNFASVSAPSFNPLEAAAPQHPVCVAGSHLQERAVEGLYFPFVGPLDSGLANYKYRVRKYRFVWDGVPAAQIYDGVADDSVWSGTWFNGFPTGTVSFPDIDTLGWSVISVAQRARFRKAKRFGLDVWLEVKRTGGSYSAGTTLALVGGFVQAQYAAEGTPLAESVISHGTFGCDLGSNNRWKSAGSNYRLDFSDGTFRPLQGADDTFQWTRGGSGTTFSSCRVAVTSGGSPLRDGLLLDWRNEHFVLQIDCGDSRHGSEPATVFYVPSDLDGYIQRWNYPDQYGFVAGPAYARHWYFYLQHPGGSWNGSGSRVFQRFRSVQVNNSGSFTDGTASFWPEEITVTKL